MSLYFLIPIIFIIILVITLAIIFFLQWRIQSENYEVYFPIRKSEPAWIERDTTHAVVLKWDDTLQPESIALKTAPDSGETLRTWKPKPGQQQIELSAQETDFRPFFILHTPDQPDRVVSTRFQPFDHVRNFRDLGGYYTADGQQIAWGLLYRSGHLSKPTSADVELLKTLQIRSIVDLRDDEEVAELPDNVPPEIQHRRIFITDRVMVHRASVMIRRHRLSSEFHEAYKQMIIEDGAPGIGKVIEILSDPANLPAVIHCTAGKDRAGMISALILLTLGVPEETVIADYTLSNHFAEYYIQDIERRISKVRWLGMRREHFYPMAAARPSVMEGALTYVRQTYGSAEQYLIQRAGVSNAVIQRLKETML